VENVELKNMGIYPGTTYLPGPENNAPSKPRPNFQSNINKPTPPRHINRKNIKPNSHKWENFPNRVKNSWTYYNTFADFPKTAEWLAKEMEQPNEYRKLRNTI